MNPFVFGGASNLTNKQILNLFIHDYNYSRLIQSKRNFFFWGERGAGKTMTLLYNKLVMQKNIEDLIDSREELEYIPVYVSCITPLVLKREYLLLSSEFQASVVSEHYLALSMALAIVDSLLETPKILNIIDQEELQLELEYLLGESLPPTNNVLKGIKLFLRKQLVNTQKEINRPDSDNFYHDTYTFSSLLMPLMEVISSMEGMNSAHFVFMMDDAHDLNDAQRGALNSWVAYRDNSLFSFKISAAKVSDYNLSTTSGGAILQGHDYSAVNMEQAFQNQDSAYGKMAKRILSKRLEYAGYPQGLMPEDFFPESEGVKRDIDKSKEEARLIAVEKYGESEAKKISDYVYKYSRAIYFRSRSPKANRVQYSGLDTLIYLSSGVIRNLLEPCYIMYDDMCSEDDKLQFISPGIQAETIKRLSDNYWEKLRHGLDKELPDCTEEQGVQIYNFFDALSRLFRTRLLDPECSEPRAISFTISGKEDEYMDKLRPILSIARSAQLLYIRSGTAKDRGEKEDYYVPNRMLWPARGLDPVGQHARVSILAKKLVDALDSGEIPYNKDLSESTQIDIFDSDKEDVQGDIL